MLAHFTDEETEAQSETAPCLRSHSWFMVDSGFTSAALRSPSLAPWICSTIQRQSRAMWLDTVWAQLLGTEDRTVLVIAEWQASAEGSVSVNQRLPECLLRTGPCLLEVPKPPGESPHPYESLGRGAVGKVVPLPSDLLLPCLSPHCSVNTPVPELAAPCPWDTPPLTSLLRCYFSPPHSVSSLGHVFTAVCLLHWNVRSARAGFGLCGSLLQSLEPCLAQSRCSNSTGGRRKGGRGDSRAPGAPKAHPPSSQRGPQGRGHNRAGP